MEPTKITGTVASLENGFVRVVSKDGRVTHVSQALFAHNGFESPGVADEVQALCVLDSSGEHYEGTKVLNVQKLQWIRRWRQ
jgi:hypothetical protein